MTQSKKVEESLHQSKAITKAVKKLGNLTVEELDSLNENELKSRVVQASQAMKEVEEELAANDEYQILKDKVSAMSQGKKDVDARQKAIVKYCLHRVTEIGKDPSLAIAIDKKRRARLEAEVKKHLAADGIEAEVSVNGK